MPFVVFPQAKPLKVVFDVTSKDTLTHQAVLRHVKGMSEMYPHAMLEVVIYGGAWPIVVLGESSSENTVADLVKQKNVSFKICNLAMERYGIERADLIPGVGVVPDAILEIVTKQGEGYGYIKESHN
jgi:intracellular sulfur oxidation DsrE/DsrF family protein